MTMYFFYQEVEKGKWFPALASERENLIKTKKPALVSALDVDNSFDHDLTLEETRALRYSGPAYFDWDAENLEEATQQFQKFLTNLKAKGVNLDMLKLYATGKKGYHLEIPMPVFMGKPPANGTAFLPDMYREMAHNLFVDTLDMRVYTARRGRMWRCTNVKRDNEKHKVQISPDEAFAMTTEEYFRLCDSPRNALPTEPPAMNAELGLLFAQARDKVEVAAKKKSTKKAPTDQLAKFKGEWPETLQHILLGVTVKPGVGWNHISLQLCIAASELGKTEEQLLADAGPLINSHESDSTRYNTPYKRTADLREMFRYVAGNPCYEYSAGGVLSLVMPEVRANADIATGDWQPEVKAPAEPTILPDGTVVEVVPEVEEEEDDNAPVKVDRRGVFVRSDQGYVRASDLGIGRAIALKRMDGQDVGYEVEVFKNAKPLGFQTLPMDKLSSRSAFQSFSFQWSMSMSASDIQTAKIADILGRRAEKNNDVTYVVGREGIDLVVPKGSKSEDDFEVIWSAPDKVLGSKGGKYRFRSSLGHNGAFNSDLMDAPELTVEDEALINHILRMNTTRNLAQLLGWFSATFLTQIIRRFYKQFPVLQVFGQAGAGKSKSVALLNHLGYYMKDPKELQALGTTQFAVMSTVASSASQTVVFEEVKAREMTPTLHNFLLNILRCNYDGLSISRGGLTKDAASKEVVVNTYENVGPVVFVGESVETQSALLERCIVVSLTKQDRYGKDAHYHYARDHAPELGKLGKAMATNVLALDIRQMRTDLDTIFGTLRDEIGKKADEFERPVFNIAVLVLGLKLLGDTLRQVFGSKFDERIVELQDSLTCGASDNLPVNMSEASRVLDVMAQLTRNQDVQYQIVKGTDYILGSDGTLDLKLRTVYSKYVKWQRSLGMEVLFDNETAFISGMSNYAGTIKRACPESPMFDSVKAVVYRLSVEFMDKEGVDSFRE